MRPSLFLLGLPVLAACSQPASCPCARVATPAAAAPVRVIGKPICPPPTGDERQELLRGTPMHLVCENVYVEPAMNDDDRESVMRWYSDSLAELGRLFSTHDPSTIPLIVCKTSECATKFAGPSRRSRIVSQPRPAIVIAGLGRLAKATFVHEMIHVEIERRTAGKPQVPAWFNEGVATYLSDNVICDGVAPSIDDLRRLSQGSAWSGFTERPSKIDGAYCQARDEIGAWAASHGRERIVPLIDAVAAGKAFDELYGPMLTKGAPGLATAHALVGKFGFDEKDGIEASDQTGNRHKASLVQGAIRAQGHKGQAVRVKDGAHVRVDGFEEYGLPDAPFTLSLWVKPASDAKVLVHTSAPVEGSGGWCQSLLGFDAGAHLVAQTPFATEPKAFLTATGPVLALRKWSHVAVEWSEPGGLRLFVNGKMVADVEPKSSVERHRDAPASPMFLFLGSDRRGQCWTSTIEGGDFDGTLDEVHVYSYALTPAEIADDMKSG
jgi:hypothetical protein